jgi:hypothetical protein
MPSVEEVRAAEQQEAAVERASSLKAQGNQLYSDTKYQEVSLVDDLLRWHVYAELLEGALATWGVCACACACVLYGAGNACGVDMSLVEV